MGSVRSAPGVETRRDGGPGSASIMARSPAGRWLGPAIIAVALPLMLAWSWEKWPDPLIDFGRELYAPWQLAAGRVLYRDVAAWAEALHGALAARQLTAAVVVGFARHRVLALARSHLTAAFVSWIAAGNGYFGASR